MSKKNKLKKFSDLLTYSNVYENTDPKDPKLVLSDGVIVHRKGKWSQDHFGNDRPIVLELACGRGEYTVALARNYKNKNFIGVDVKGARIWQGANIALEESLTNAAFLRTRIEQLHLFFGHNEVDEIWITFPDPFLRESKEQKRLTSARFIDAYRKILKSKGICHLKTDDSTLYSFTIETLLSDPGTTIIYQNEDIYAGELPFAELEYKTYYEKSHLLNGRKIKYVRFLIS